MPSVKKFLMILGAAFLFALWFSVVVRRVEDSTWKAPDPVCYEDMPCWDCETMGNRICGEKKP